MILTRPGGTRYNALMMAISSAKRAMESDDVSETGPLPAPRQSGSIVVGRLAPREGVVPEPSERNHRWRTVDPIPLRVDP